MPLLSVPPNAPATIGIDAVHRTLTLTYNGKVFFEGRFSKGTHLDVVSAGDPERIQQAIEIRDGSVEGTVTASEEAFAAETMGNQQRRFPVVRNSDGPSRNLRNNAVYDRKQDAVLIGPTDGATVISPLGRGRFSFRCAGDNFHIVFRPRYYQKHKNIAYFQPWEHETTREPIAGWCSWWAYRGDVTEKDVLAAADVFARKLKPFGFRIIQVDDGYQSGEGAPPSFWTKTNGKFPSGLKGLAKAISGKGLTPGIWMGTQITDDGEAKAHPDWFVRNPDGSAHKGPWISYGVDGSNKTALKELFQPVFEEYRRDGFGYVKIDSLRHLLYDSLYPDRDQMLAEGVKPEDAFRDYLGFARKTLGEDTYLLACWGVLPEAAGIADACRLGGDGFGPSTMQQYNSWNNVVWRNDPDHVDLQGPGEEIIRPTLVSMAGAQLLLSDRAEFYEDDSHLEGAKRAAPIPITLPGQLYDFDPSKTDNLLKGLRNQNGGSNAGPIDATQGGSENPWWQLDMSRPFEDWTVLARLSWSDLPSTEVKFRDLGLKPGTYAVYEFWSKKYLGEFTDSFPCPPQQAKVASVFSIRAVENHPQVVSTNRHITQGGPDLEDVQWLPHHRILEGESSVVGEDRYEVVVRCAGRNPIRASSSYERDGDLLRLSWTPGKSGTAKWWIEFSR